MVSILGQYTSLLTFVLLEELAPGNSALLREQVYQFLQKPISLAGAEGVIPTEKPSSRVPREAALGAGGKCASGSVRTRESGGLAAGCGARTPPRPGPPRGEDELGPGGGAGLQKRGPELGRGGPARADQGPPGVRGVEGGAPELGRPGGLWSLRRRLVRAGAGWAAVSPGKASCPVARRDPRRPLPETSNVPEPGEPSHPVRLPHSLSDEPEDHIFAVSSPVTMVTLPPQHSYLLWVQYDGPSSGVGKQELGDGHWNGSEGSIAPGLLQVEIFRVCWGRLRVVPEAS
nr:segment polarity protein dishevelled homolog DVL-2-like [Kogia breviceps]